MSSFSKIDLKKFFSSLKVWTWTRTI